MSMTEQEFQDWADGTFDGVPKSSAEIQRKGKQLAAEAKAAEERKQLQSQILANQAERQKQIEAEDRRVQNEFVKRHPEFICNADNANQLRARVTYNAGATEPIPFTMESLETSAPGRSKPDKHSFVHAIPATSGSRSPTWR